MASTDDMRLYKSPESYRIMTQFYENGLAKLGVDYESRFVPTRFGQTHLLAAGPEAAPPLILVQGMAGSCILWHRQLADFARSRRVYALDTVGQPGRSAPNPPSLFDDGYARWLVDVLDALQLERADFAGVSLGGWAIIYLGILAPDRLRKAVLLSPMGLARGKMHIRRWIPNPTRKDPGDTDLEARLQKRSFNPSASSDGRAYDQQLARAMALATKHYRVDLSMGIRPEQSRAGKLWTGARVLMKFMRPIPLRDLRRFAGPALLILGEHEVLYDPQASVRRAQSAMAALTAVIVPGAGHAAMYDKPEVVNPLILKYLQD